MYSKEKQNIESKTYFTDEFIPYAFVDRLLEQPWLLWPKQNPIEWKTTMI